MPILDGLNQAMATSPFHQWLGCSVTSLHPDTGTVEVQLPLRNEIVKSDRNDYVHGGVLAALVDIAAHAAIHAVTKIHMPTIDLRIDFLRRARAPLTARATPRRIGRSIGVADVEILDNDGQLVGLGRAVFRTAAPQQPVHPK